MPEKSTTELTQERGGLFGKMEALAEENAKQPFSKEQRDEWDKLETRVKHLDEQIERAGTLDRFRPKQRETNEIPPVPAEQNRGENRGEDGRLRTPEHARAIAHRPLRGFESEEQAHRAGQWLAATVFKSPEARDWCYDHGFSTRALSTTSNVAGGVLVPAEFERAIILLREKYGVARAKCRLYPMTSDSVTVPRRTGGVTTYYVGENVAVTASDTAYDGVQLVTRNLAALVKLSSMLNDDAVIDMASHIADEIAYAFAVEEDQALLLGDGTSTYGGIEGLITACTTATATIVTAAAGNTAFSTLDMADFEAMIGKLPAFGGIEPEWYIHKAGWGASMLRLLDAAGGNTIRILEDGSVRQSFLGFPVNFVQCMNSTLTAQVSAKGICYFGDLKMATTFGDRRGVNIEVLRERYAEYLQIGIIGHERYDINVHDVGDTSNAGAVIMLAMPGA